MFTTHDEKDLELVVTERGDDVDDVCALTLAHPDGTALPEWEPGAHIDLTVSGAPTRQYSLCGDPAERHGWRVAVLRERSSRGGSAAVHERLAPGDRVRVRGPRNHFALVDAPRYLLIAGGIGITPLIPMARALRERAAEWTMAYGGRTRSSMYGLDELTGSSGDRVVVHPQDTDGLLPIADLLSSAGADTAVYCCGPEALIEAVEQEAGRLGLPEPHVERFAPRENPAPDDTGIPFEVEARRSGVVTTVRPGESILDVLESAGVRMYSSCREGLCGTCESDVLEGRPDHRDSILDDEAREASETMFPCVSRSHSPRLVLDI